MAEAGDERCTAALLLEVDPLRLARGRRTGSPDFSLGQYVDDRPYAASSMLGVALGRVFGTARAGRCEGHQELADAALPLEITVPVLPCRCGRAWRTGCSRRWAGRSLPTRSAAAALEVITTQYAAVGTAARHALPAALDALALAEPHPWHLAELGRLTDEFLTPTRHRVVDVSSPVERDAATAWWLELTDSGGEGMVVKPADPRL